MSSVNPIVFVEYFEELKTIRGWPGTAIILVFQNLKWLWMCISYKIVLVSLQDSVKHQVEKAGFQQKKLKTEEKFQDGVCISSLG